MSPVPTPSPLPGLAGEHVVVHAALRPLRNHWECDTGTAAAALLDALHTSEAASVVVPTFTYTYTTSRAFDVRSSPSEVGAFSEHVRSVTSARQRTLDPVFSVVDATDHGWADGRVSTAAFDEQSLWHRWDLDNATIVGIGLEQLVLTQLHYVEQRCAVPYRFTKAFPGEVTDADGTTHHVDYQYVVRDLDEDPQWDRAWVRSFLEEAGALTATTWEGVEVTLLHAGDLRRALEPLLAEHPRALLTTR
ncbi:MAG: AAC(3) family N-acetyltransferase [Acidimicrobiia bacterium]|nr:AAC(3) family N-acetyltransferase [Acidimicrobiia bacterium]